MLAALSLLCVLGYGMASAVTTQNGYAALRLRREIEDLRAEKAFLRYQISFIQSRQRIAQAAARLDLQRADPVREVDYVALPASQAETGLQMTAAESQVEPRGLRALLAGLARQMAGGGRAEASTVESPRP